LLHSYALKAFLQEELYAVIVSNDFQTQYTFKSALTCAEIIPVYRVKSSFPIIYRCAIAKQVTAKAEEFARRLVEKLRENQLFSVEILRSPWLDFRLSDRALASWLDDLLKLSPPPLPNLATSGFNLSQYTHARCLSLLYSASRDGLIALQPSPKSLSWQWCAPSSIPWQSCWQHPAEIALIVELVDLCDRARGDRVRSWQKQALNLSQKILDCDRACRIRGQPLEISRARLGLIAVAQRILGWILQEKLMVIPWLEC
jgi:arginyl-tRNA synthetase